MALTRKISSRRSMASVMAAVVTAFGSIAGKRPSARRQTQYRAMFLGAYAYKLFLWIHDGYIRKSRRGSDTLGLRWAELSPSTIAQRALSPGERRFYGIPGRTTRGLLTAEQDRRWRGIFASTLARLTAEGQDERQAKQSAAKTAWAILKSQGAQTKKGLAKGRKPPILIDKGRMEKSFRPGSLTTWGYRKFNRDQIYVRTSTGFEMGSAVEYSGYHQRGTSRMPARPPIPDARRMRRWTLDAMAFARDRVASRLEQDLKS